MVVDIVFFFAIIITNNLMQIFINITSINYLDTENWSIKVLAMLLALIIFLFLLFSKSLIYIGNLL